MTDSERQALIKRLNELNGYIAKAECWGAALTAWNEERNGIERALGYDGEGENK